jgi:8-oxo-dGTP pyrophosphatase MutT (NUDIX family)
MPPVHNDGSRMVEHALHGVAGWAVRCARRVLRRLGARPGPGAHAVAVGASGGIVLVRLRYARGWRLPGGGRRRGEPAQAAALRELREEIGMRGHSGIAPVPGSTRGGDLFVVRDVVWRARRWSLEIAEVREFPPGAFPPDLARIARRQLDRAADAMPDLAWLRAPAATKADAAASGGS